MKIVGETTCPNCQKAHEAALDLDKFEPKVTTSVIQNPSISSPTATVTSVLAEEKPKVITKIPSYIPNYKCKNCGNNHKNKDYSVRPKFKCSKCGQFSPDGELCAWCKSKEFDEIDEEELDDLGIPEPEEHEHEEE